MEDKLEVVFRKIIDFEEVYAVFPYRITDRNGGMLAIKVMPFKQAYVAFSYNYYNEKTEKCCHEEKEDGIEKLKEMGYKVFDVIEDIDIEKHDSVCEERLIFNAKGT